MSAHAIVADVLLGLAAAVVLASSAGILVMRDAYQRLHYVTPIVVVAPVLVALAVLVQSGWTENSGQTWLATAVHAGRRALPGPRHAQGRPDQADRRLAGRRGPGARRPCAG